MMSFHDTFIKYKFIILYFLISVHHCYRDVYHSLQLFSNLFTKLFGRVSIPGIFLSVFFDVSFLSVDQLHLLYCLFYYPLGVRFYLLRV